MSFENIDVDASWEQLDVNYMKSMAAQMFTFTEAVREEKIISSDYRDDAAVAQRARKKAIGIVIALGNRYRQDKMESTKNYGELWKWTKAVEYQATFDFGGCLKEAYKACTIRLLHAADEQRKRNALLFLVQHARKIELEGIIETFGKEALLKDLYTRLCLANAASETLPLHHLLSSEADPHYVPQHMVPYLPVTRGPSQGTQTGFTNLSDESEGDGDEKRTQSPLGKRRR